MPQTAFDYLSAHVLLTLATSSSDGRPHAAPIFYVSDQSTIYFSTSGETESGRNLAANPTASITVADVPTDWGKARGVQITGDVKKVDGGDAEKAATLFADRFPFLQDPKKYDYYALTPDEIHYIHNDEDADEDIEALGVHWLRETVES
jgi:uncharacterized protein YhbP (UPF0306 family)